MASNEFGSTGVRKDYSILTYLKARKSAKAPPERALKATDEAPRPNGDPLFDFQMELVEGLLSLYESKKRNRRGLVSLPTGAGKTRVGVWAILQLLKEAKVRTALWVAPTVELLAQGEDAFTDLAHYFPEVKGIELIRGIAIPAKDEIPRVFFATPQLLYSRIGSKPNDVPLVDFVLFDEAHQSLAPSYRSSLDWLMNRSGATCVIVGLSATPGRTNLPESDNLSVMFNRELIVSKALGRRPVDELQRRGVLGKIEFKNIELAVGNKSIRVDRESLGKVSSERLSYDVERFRAVIRTLLALPTEDRAIVFAGSVPHANAIFCVLKAAGKPCAVITHDTESGQRKQAIDDFKHGKCQFLVNKTILATGYDCPATRHIILSCPIGSAILFEQAVGRVARGPAVGGKGLGTVWQIDNHVGIHGIPSSYYRFRDVDWN